MSLRGTQDTLTIEDINARVVRCTRCRELRTYCAQVAVEKKLAYRDWTYWGKPVPSFGDPKAQVLLVGLAPGAHGSNRTGRPFTGDASGSFLYPALFRAGFANQPTAVHRDDGLHLRNCLITAAVRCAPPANKPTPRELANCAPYLAAEFVALRRLRVVVALGSVAHKAALSTFRAGRWRIAPERPIFGHAVECTATLERRSVAIVSSFHPSRQNTNTGKLTKAMFDRIFARVNELLAL